MRKNIKNMKNIKHIKKSVYFSLIIVLSFSYLSCTKYLDVIPEGKATISDIYKTQQQAQAFVYSLYSQIPELFNSQRMPDLFCGGDFVSGYYGSVRYFHYKSLLYGNESPSSTYWGMWSTTSSFPTGAVTYDIFGAIRNCYNFLNNVGSVPDITADNLKYWKGEAYFLIAYYHQRLLEYYGPTVLIKKEIPLDASEEDLYLERSPYDSCVSFIARKYDSAAALLPDKWGSDEIGRATKAAALGMKARVLLYDASPLVNGNTEFYADFKNPDGKNLVSQVYDKEKWNKAMQSAEAAITYCEGKGFKLYVSPGAANENDSIRGKENYHRCFVGEGAGSSFWNTSEILFGTGKQSDVSYMIKNIAPRIGVKSYTTNGLRGYIMPTWDCITTYYTKNGLPLDVDPLTKNEDLYTVAPGDSTARLNRNREPRFYASIGFDRGPYELNGGKIIIRSRRGEEQQNDGNSSHEYQTDNGYYCQKWVSSIDSYNPTNNTISYNKYEFPLLRLAELYLDYVEADFEYNGTLSAKSLTYLNKIRHRAGLPNFQDSWALVGGMPTGAALRKILHQERTIEFFMEGIRYHDIRRWKVAEEVMTRPWYSWNLAGKTQDEFYQVKPMQEGGVRVFESPKNYWLAIPLDQMNTNYNLVQNPGY